MYKILILLAAFVFTRLYSNKLKSWEFGKEIPQILSLQQATVFIDTERAGEKESETKSTRPKTNSSICLSINADVAVLGNYKIDKNYFHEMFPETTFHVYQQLSKGEKVQKTLWSKWLSPRLIPLAEYGDKIAFFNISKKPSNYYSFKGIPKENLALVMWEPPTVLPRMYNNKLLKHFGMVFTWDDELVDNKKFFKIYYPDLRQMTCDVVPFEKKKFCTLIATNLSSSSPYELYSERRCAARFFETKPPGEFDLYGKRWGPKYKTWKGPVDNKIETLKQYRFSICFENMKGGKGYITEKIFDCFHAGVVPVYLGPSNIEDYIPQDCFIDMRGFSSYEELYTFLKGISKTDYEGYLQRIQAFLASEKAQFFTKAHFAKVFSRFLDKK